MVAGLPYSISVKARVKHVSDHALLCAVACLPNGDRIAVQGNSAGCTSIGHDEWLVHIDVPIAGAVWSGNCRGSTVVVNTADQASIDLFVGILFSVEHRHRGVECDHVLFLPNGRALAIIGTRTVKGHATQIVRQHAL